MTLSDQLEQVYPADTNIFYLQLWEECLLLQQEVDRVRSEETHFKVENNMAQRSWDTSKRELEETKDRMRDGLRLKLDTKRRHREDIRELQQRLKTTQTVHMHEITELKIDNFARKSELATEHRLSEVQLLKKVHNSQADKREKEAAAKVLITEINQKHLNEMEELNDSYEQKATEIGVYYDKKTIIMIEENEKKIRIELDEIDTGGRKQCASVALEMEKTLAVMKSTLVTRKEIQAEIRSFERDIMKATQTDRRMSKAQQDRQKLMERLKRLREHRQQLPDKWTKDISGLVLDKGLELLVKHLDLKEVQRERDHVWTDADEFLRVYEKCSLKGTWLEREMVALAECKDEQPLEVWLALFFVKGVKTAAERVQELVESKRAALRAVRLDVSQLLMEYDELVKKAKAVGKPLSLTLSMDAIERSIWNASQDRTSKVLQV
ncbi:hypothetical protein PAMP_018116 [Pampus punctatissimus]